MEAVLLDWPIFYSLPYIFCSQKSFLGIAIMWFRRRSLRQHISCLSIYELSKLRTQTHTATKKHKQHHTHHSGTWSYVHKWIIEGNHCGYQKSEIVNSNTKITRIALSRNTSPRVRHQEYVTTDRCAGAIKTIPNKTIPNKTKTKRHIAGPCK